MKRIILRLALLVYSSIAIAIYGQTNSDLFITIWKTDNLGSSSSTSITIPTYTTSYSYSYEVDWDYNGITFSSDGTIYTGNASHDYGIAGTYTVAIVGTFPLIFFNNEGDKDKIVTIEQWGTNEWKSMSKAFYGCSNLNITNVLEEPNLTNVTSMADMFKSASLFNGDLSNWNVSQVQQFARMFEGATAFNQDLSNWNVENAINMTGMFYGATDFDQDLGNWDLGNIKHMEDMFFDVTLATANYDALLIGWNTDSSGIIDDGIDDIPSHITFSGGDSVYCTGETARNSLINTYHWSISDNGLDCSDLSVDQSALASVNIYPNPTQNILYIDGLQHPASVEIYDFNGKLLKQIDNYLNQPIDLTQLDNGLYAVKVTDYRFFKNFTFIKI